MTFFTAIHYTFRAYLTGKRENSPCSVEQELGWSHLDDAIAAAKDMAMAYRLDRVDITDGTTGELMATILAEDW